MQGEYLSRALIVLVNRLNSLWGGQSLYSEFLIPFRNVPNILHRNIKFNELRLCSILLFRSDPRCHSEILLRSALSVNKSLYTFSLNTIFLCLRIIRFSGSQNRKLYSLVTYPMKMHLLDFGSNLLLRSSSTWTYEIQSQVHKWFRFFTYSCFLQNLTVYGHRWPSFD